MLCNIIQSNCSHFSPENTFFAFDIDDVIVTPSNEWHKRDIALVASGMWLYPSNSYNWITSLTSIKSCYIKDVDGKKEKLLDEEGNPINGLAFHFLYHGMRDPNLPLYVPLVVNTIESYRTPINGTVELCHYLKSKGYTIVFATNKDRLSFDEFAQNIDSCVTNIPDTTFVAHCGNDNFLKKLAHYSKQSHIPENYKNYAAKALYAQPTEDIKHVPSVKPYPAYYEYVHASVQEKHKKKHMIFVDDKTSNINGVKQYNEQLDNGAQAIGIEFKNPWQLVQALTRLGVLSMKQDKNFIQYMQQQYK